MNEPYRVTDLLIVGAGPAGLTAALFAKNRGLDVLVLEGAEAGGQLRSVYPHKPVLNYPGSMGVRAAVLAARMVEQVVSAGIAITEHCPVESLEPAEGQIRARSRAGVVGARAVVVASGMGLFEPKRVGVPGEVEEAGRTVFYAIADPVQWHGLDVVVLGGGDSAVDNALLLLRSGARVTLVHRRTELRAQEQSIRLLRAEGGGMLLGWTVVSLGSTGDGLEVRLESNGSEGRTTLSVDRALVNIGMVARNAFLASFTRGATRARVPVDTEMRAIEPGVFACGDVAEYPGKARLIVTAMGEAATAIGSVERYLDARAGGAPAVDPGAPEGAIPERDPEPTGG